MTRVVELRTYSLLPGVRSQFDCLMRDMSVPMLRRFGTDVVTFGPSLGSEDGYYLVRSYASSEQLEREQSDFYGSSEWRNGPREEILSLIHDYVSFRFVLEGEVVEAMRLGSLQLD